MRQVSMARKQIKRCEKYVGRQEGDGSEGEGGRGKVRKRRALYLALRDTLYRRSSIGNKFHVDWGRK